MNGPHVVDWAFSRRWIRAKGWGETVGLTSALGVLYGVVLLRLLSCPNGRSESDSYDTAT